MVQPVKGWVRNEVVDITSDVSPVSSPVTVLSHPGEFNKVKLRLYSHNCFG